MTAAIRFDNQVVLITGAGRGIGRALALLLASRGAKIIVADNGAAMDGADASQAPAEAVTREITAGMAIACTADIATEAGAAAAVQAALTAFGRIDAIAHLASTSPNLTPADQLCSHDLDLVMRVNAMAGLWLARAAWPQMRQQNYGRIILATSAGIYGSHGNAHYAAAKAAQIGALRCLAIEGRANGIRVNGIAPSARTRMTERFTPSAYAEWFFNTMKPEAVATGAAYLLSEACEISGEILSLGGGRIARIVLSECEGVLAAGGSIEDVRDVMPQLMTDSNFFHPQDLAERSTKVAAFLGFHSGLDFNSIATVSPIEKG